MERVFYHTQTCVIIERWHWQQIVAETVLHLRLCELW